MAKTNKSVVNKLVIEGLGTPKGFKAETRTLIKTAKQKELHEVDGKLASADQIIQKARVVLNDELKYATNKSDRKRIQQEIKVLDKPGIFNTQLEVAHKYITKYKMPEIEARIQREQRAKYINGAESKAKELCKKDGELSKLTGDGLVNTLLDKKTFRRNGVYNKNKFKALPPAVKNAFSTEVLKMENFKALTPKQKTKVFDKALNYQVGKSPRDSASMGGVFKEMVNSLEGPQKKKNGKLLTDNERVELYDRYFKSSRTLTGKHPAAISQLKSKDRGEVYGHLFKSEQFSKLQPKFMNKQIDHIQKSTAFKAMDDKDKLKSYGALLDNIHKNKALKPEDIAKTYAKLVTTKEGSLNPFKKATAYDKMSPNGKSELFGKMLNSESFGSLNPKQQRKVITNVSNTTAFKKLGSEGKAAVYSTYLSGPNFGKLTPKEQTKTLDKVLNSKGFKSLDSHDKVDVISKYMESNNLKVTDKFKAKDQRAAVKSVMKSDTFRDMKSGDKAHVLTNYIKSDNLKRPVSEGSNIGSESKKDGTNIGRKNNKYKAITNVLSTTHNGKKVFNTMDGSDRANVVGAMVDASKGADAETKSAISRRLVYGTRFQTSPIYKVAKKNPEAAAKLFGELLSKDFTEHMTHEQKNKHCERILDCKAFKKLTPEQRVEVATRVAEVDQNLKEKTNQILMKNGAGINQSSPPTTNIASSDNHIPNHYLKQPRTYQQTTLNLNAPPLPPSANTITRSSTTSPHTDDRGVPKNDLKSNQNKPAVQPTSTSTITVAPSPPHNRPKVVTGVPEGQLLTTTAPPPVTSNKAAPPAGAFFTQRTQQQNNTTQPNVNSAATNQLPPNGGNKPQGAAGLLNNDKQGMEKATNAENTQHNTTKKVLVDFISTTFETMVFGPVLPGASLISVDNTKEEEKNKNQDATTVVRKAPPLLSETNPVTTAYKGVPIPSSCTTALSNNGCTTATNSNLQSSLSPSSVPKFGGVGGQSVGTAR